MFPSNVNSTNDRFRSFSSTNFFFLRLIHRMIVRDPEKRATLDEVMADAWYRQSTGETDDDDNDEEIDPLKFISKDDHEYILRQMIAGNIADSDDIQKALDEGQYNHITATYHLLAEKILLDERDGKKTQKRKFLQPTSDPFTEKIGGLQ